MADADKTLELLIKLGVVGKADVEAANDLLLKTTKTSNEALDESTEKWKSSRREIREVGNEIGRVTGIGHLGGLFLAGLPLRLLQQPAPLRF